MTPLHTTLRAAVAAHKAALDEALRAEWAWFEDPDLDFQPGLSCQAFARPQDEAPFIRAGHHSLWTIHDTPTSNHAILAEATILAPAKQRAQAVHDALLSTITTLLHTMRQGPVTLHTPYEPCVFTGITRETPWARVSASADGTVTGGSEIMLEEDGLTTLTNLACIATFNDTIGTGPTWVVHDTPSGTTIPITAPTPGDALQWAAVRLSHAFLVPGRARVEGVEEQTTQRSLDAAWRRIGMP